MAGLLVVLGIRSALRWRHMAFEVASSGEALLYALHVSCRVATWFAFAAVFVALGVLDEPTRYRWFVLIPIVLAGVQLLTGLLLSRERPAHRDMRWRGDGKTRDMSTDTYPVGPLEPEKEGSSADPGHPQPAAPEVESARLLANDAVEILVPEGYTRDQVRRLADAWVALDLGEEIEDFLAWARSEEDPANPPSGG